MIGFIHRFCQVISAKIKNKHKSVTIQNKNVIWLKCFFDIAFILFNLYILFCSHPLIPDLDLVLKMWNNLLTVIFYHFKASISPYDNFFKWLQSRVILLWLSFCDVKIRSGEMIDYNFIFGNLFLIL